MSHLSPVSLTIVTLCNTTAAFLLSQEHITHLCDTPGQDSVVWEVDSKVTSEK